MLKHTMCLVSAGAYSSLRNPRKLRDNREFGEDHQTASGNPGRFTRIRSPTRCSGNPGPMTSFDALPYRWYIPPGREAQAAVQLDSASCPYAATASSSGVTRATVSPTMMRTLPAESGLENRKPCISSQPCKRR